MSDHPDTIYSPESFDKSQWHIECPYCGETIGFDGIFNWGWMLDLLPRKISPMDFDGVIEAGQGHYLIMETKDTGKEIPTGQMYTLSRLHRAKSFVVMMIWGKDKPEYFTWIKRNGQKADVMQAGIGNARDFIDSWIKAAEGGLLD